MKLHRLWAIMAFVTVILFGQSATDPSSGIKVTLDTSTNPAIAQVKWWGESDYHYLLEYTLEIGEPWLSVQGVNPHGEDGILMAPIDIFDFEDRIFFRLLTFGPDTIFQFTDIDSNGLPDIWEIFYFGGITLQSANDDPDLDGLDNLGECLYGTDPNNADTDWDDLSDGDEALIWSTSPVRPDTDNDGMNDGWETNYSLDPNDDGSTDVSNGSLGDPDSDGLSNLVEMWNSSDPHLADTDSDGLSDGVEINLYNTYAWNADSDEDGLNDSQEVVLYGTDPRFWDTDEDTLSDYDETLLWFTNPLVTDTDGDTIPDAYEVDHSLNPNNSLDALLDADSDGMSNVWEYHNGLDPLTNDNTLDFDRDGLANLAEYNLGTKANNFDTDGDLLPDGWEVQKGLNALNAIGNNGTNGDPDNDNLDNLNELINQTNPQNDDTDGDGVSDGDEVNGGSDPNDSNDNGLPPPADEIFEVPFTVGDPSGSHSERWAMNIIGTNAKDGRSFTFVTPQFGVVEPKTFKLRRGASYEITLTHQGTSAEHLEEEGESDYDWEATLAGKPTSLGTSSPNELFGVVVNNENGAAVWVAKNQDGLFTTIRHGNSTDITIGMKATLEPLEFITPAGDPVNAPIDAGSNQSSIPDGANEFTYSLAHPVGTLVLRLKASFPNLSSIPADLGSHLFFSVDAIGNSVMAWDAANSNGVATINGNTLTAIVTFTGLPELNSDFGSKVSRIKYDAYITNETPFEVFYYRHRFNHPGGQANSPNWYHYWKQLLPGYDLEFEPNQPPNNANLNGRVNGMVNWSYATTQSKTRITIYPACLNEGGQYFNFGNYNSGIDYFYAMVLHEAQHVIQIAQADMLVSSGFAGTPWKNGWSWNTELNNHNHWFINDFLPGVALTDDDGDGNIDNLLESGSGELGKGNPTDDIILRSQQALGPDWPQAWPIPSPMPHPLSEIESDAINAGNTHLENSKASLDWGNPGKNHNTNNWND